MKIFDVLNKVMLHRLFIFDKPYENLTEAQHQAISVFQSKVEKGMYSFEDASCLCGNSEGILLTERDRYCLPVKTYLCTNCGTLRTSPRLDEPSLSTFYDQDYRSIYVGCACAPDEFFNQQKVHGTSIFKFVWSEISQAKTLTVFDVGCGAGGTLVPFKNAGCKVLGCDLGSQYLDRGRSTGLTLEHGDVESLYKHGEADLIILSHVLEHFPKPLDALRKISQGMSSSGFIYVEVPGVFNIHNSYNDPLLYFQNAHLYHFNLSTLTFLMQQAGFELVKGDESIQAIYKKTDKVVSFSLSSDWYFILSYFYFAEINRRFQFLQIIKNQRYYLSKIVRLLLSDSVVDKFKRRLSKS